MEENQEKQAKVETHAYIYNTVRKLDRAFKLMRETQKSFSRRLTRLSRNVSQIVANQKHYLKKKLPLVLEREKKKNILLADYHRIKKQLESYGRMKFRLLSKDARRRYIMYLTYPEIRRLNYLLEKPFLSIALRPLQKKRRLIFLSKKERRRLNYLLKQRRKKDEKLADIKGSNLLCPDKGSALDTG